MVCGPSGTGCSSMGPLQGHKPCQQTCSSMGFSLQGFTEALPEACSSTGSSWGHSPLAPARHPAQAAGGYLLHYGPPWTAGDGLLHCGLLYRQQKNHCSSAWSTSFPFFFPNLGLCRVVFLSYSHSSLLTAGFFLSF